MKALVIDPSTVYQMMLSSIIADTGIDASCVRNEKEAIDIIEKESFDLICSSMHIGNMSGIELCLHIRKLDEKYSYSKLPILIITSEEDNETLNKALSAGVTQIFKKSRLGALDHYLRHLVWSQQSDEVHQAIDGHILYLEDSKATALTVIGTLEDNGLEVDHFSNLEGVLEALSSRSYDLVLTDLMIDDEVSGQTLIHIVRKDHKYDDLPILVTSELNDPNRRIALLKDGVNDFIGKPIVYDEMIIRVRNQIRTKKLIERVREQQAYLKDLAMRDQLTALYNRHFLMEVGPKYISDAERHQHALSMLVIDLDHFKNINDTLGHAAGDQVLEAMGKLLLESCRNEDVAVRFGGEEFVVILNRCDINQAKAKGEEIRTTIQRLKPANIKVTASIGVSSLKLGKKETMGNFFTRADKAVYISKSSGRNQTTTVEQ